MREHHYTCPRNIITVSRICKKVLPKAADPNTTKMDQTWQRVHVSRTLMHLHLLCFFLFVGKYSFIKVREHLRFGWCICTYIKFFSCVKAIWLIQNAWKMRANILIHLKLFTTFGALYLLWTVCECGFFDHTLNTHVRLRSSVKMDHRWKSKHTWRYALALWFTVTVRCFYLFVQNIAQHKPS